MCGGFAARIGARCLVAWLALIPAAASARRAAPAAALPAPASRRFFIQGDGRLRIRSTKNRHRFAGRFRDRRGGYAARALRQINRVFGAPWSRVEGRLSLRLIEVLSLLQQHSRGGDVIISSGYRSPAFNQRLRDKGRTVAKASLHQYGMAVDLRIAGRDSRAVWHLARRERVGGAGYYGGPWIHVDVGPVRWWTQSTAAVRQGVSDDNKRIILVPEFDRYAAGEAVSLRFARMTAYPIGVRTKLALERQRGDDWDELTRLTARFTRPPASKGTSSCLHLGSIAELAGVHVRLPQTLPGGRYRLRAFFCDARWPAMPPAITSYELAVTAAAPGQASDPR